MDLHLSGRAVYITGGAHGLGEAIADIFSESGARVVVADLDEEQLDTKREMWSAAGQRAETIVADLGTREGAENAAAGAIELIGGPPDVLVNNVGIGFNRPFDATTDDEWSKIFEINFFSYVRTSRVILPKMAARGNGTVINMASDLAKQPEATTSTYSATKAAILSLTKTLSVEYSPRGVRVNAVCPGPILTRLWTQQGGVLDQLSDLYGVDHDEALKRYVGERKIPLGVGQPIDVANLVVYLASPLAKHITGCVLDINGGSVRGMY